MKEQLNMAARAEQPTPTMVEPMQTIGDFFSLYSLERTCQELENLTQLATGRLSPGRRHGRKPMRIARFTNKLGQLVTAAWALHQQQVGGAGQESPGAPTEDTTSQPVSWEKEKAVAAHSLHFTKSKRLIDQVPHDPMGVVQEVFHCLFIEDLRDDLLPKWLRIALTNESSAYCEGEDRGQLLVLCDELLLVMEALLVISQSHIVQRKYASVELDETFRQPRLLSPEQLENPLPVIRRFCRRFDPDYVRRELWHFLEAGISYSGVYPEGFNPGWAFTCYEYVSCLTEAAYFLDEEEKVFNHN